MSLFNDVLSYSSPIPDYRLTVFAQRAKFPISPCASWIYNKTCIKRPLNLVVSQDRWSFMTGIISMILSSQWQANGEMYVLIRLHQSHYTGSTLYESRTFVINRPQFAWLVPSLVTSRKYKVYTMRTNRNVRHFANDIFRCIFVNEIFWILKDRDGTLIITYYHISWIKSVHVICDCPVWKPCNLWMRKDEEIV